MTIQQLIAECKQKVDAVDKRMDTHLYLDKTTAIEATYFYKLADQLCKPNILYVLTGKRTHDSWDTVCLESSFNYDDLWQAKNKQDYLDEFEALYIVACDFMI